jgi:hypothetical protein
MGQKAGKKKTGKFLNERLFMRNGAMLTLRYIDRQLGLGAKGERTIYIGKDGIFLCSVLEEDVMCRMNLDVPFEWKDVASSDKPGASMVSKPVAIAGDVVVHGYPWR